MVMRLLWESLKFYHRRRRHTVMPNKKEAEVHRAIVEYTVEFGRVGELRGNSHHFITTLDFDSSNSFTRQRGREAERAGRRWLCENSGVVLVGALCVARFPPMGKE